MTALRVGLMGTPDFALPGLEALHGSGHELVCVYSQPPRPKGRGHQVQPSPIHHYAQTHGIPVFHPKSLKSPEVQQEFAAHHLDVAVVAAYGLILPKAVLDAPRFGCLNIHGSLLPRWRGASPIQQAIWAGDAQTGISIMQMDEGLDTGPVIAERAVTIHPHTTALSLHDELAALGAVMIKGVIDRLAEQGHLDSKAQDDALATYAPRLYKEDGQVKWDQTAKEIDRQIRALNPWPGVYCDTTAGGGAGRLKIKAAALSEKQSTEKPGTILDRDGHVVCGGGTVLKILEVQPAGTKAMDFASAVNGGYLKPGEILQ